MAGVCTTYGEMTEIHIELRWEHLIERDNLKYLDVDESIMRVKINLAEGK